VLQAKVTDILLIIRPFCCYSSPATILLSDWWVFIPHPVIIKIFAAQHHDKKDIYWNNRYCRVRLLPSTCT